MTKNYSASYLRAWLVMSLSGEGIPGVGHTFGVCVSKMPMRRNRIKQVASALVWLCCSTAWAQVDSLLHQADRLLSYKAYGRAIDAYTQLLAEPESRLTTVQKATVQGQLAYAYKQVGDTEKAEHFYRESIGNTPGDNPQQTLRFAQALAGNGKFQEAVDLVSEGAAFPVGSTTKLMAAFATQYADPTQAARISRAYVQRNTGATGKVMEAVSSCFKPHRRTDRGSGGLRRDR